MSCKSKICNPGSGSGDKPDQWVDSKVSPEVKDGMKAVVLTDDMVKKDMTLFLDNVERGLKKDTHDDCAVKCWPTYVQDLPNGTCEGKYLALDLGGTNFRVLLVELKAGNIDMKPKLYQVPKELMVGSGTPLFDHIAACIFDFVNEQGIAQDNLPLGFTWSFPLNQKGLRVGICERWTKGFNCEDVINTDVVQWLIDAIDRRGDVKIDVCAVLNDTTGTLMSCAWKEKDCRIGIIVGTGNNGCYVEKQSNAELFDEPDMGSGKVIINLEMGAFGDDGALDYMLTDVDKAIDSTTINPGRQLHEKMISGMYLGEVVRQFALRFTEAGWMFGGQASGALKTKDKFECEYISDIESDPIGSFAKTKAICDKLGLSNATEQDFINLRYICQCVIKRSATLVAAACVVLINKMGEKKVTIGVDGSVYKYHPHYRRYMVEKITELISPGYSFNVTLAEDGSGAGAALVAAVAARVKHEHGL